MGSRSCKGLGYSAQVTRLPGCNTHKRLRAAHICGIYMLRAEVHYWLHWVEVMGTRMVRWLSGRPVLAVFSSIFLAACSAGLDTRRVDSRIANLDGQSATALRQCMGDPHSVGQTESGEVWRYEHERVEHRNAYDLYGGTPGVIIRMPASTQRGTCSVDVTVRDDLVRSITFGGNSGSGTDRRWACLPLVENCQ